MEMNYPERHHELQTLLCKMQRDISGPVAAFEKLHKDTIAVGALSIKHKELMALAIAIAMRCDDRIAYHVHDALRAGASRQEILETASVAIMMGGSPAMMYACRTYDSIEQFEGRVGTLPLTTTFPSTGVNRDSV
jgi:AhpD family alkylhydroperoxidase